MGGSSQSCASAKLVQPQIYLECYTGSMTHDPKNFEFGVMPSDVANAKYCTEEALWADIENKDRYHCTNVMDRDAMLKRVMGECAGQGNCTVSLANWAVSGTA